MSFGSLARMTTTATLAGLKASSNTIGGNTLMNKTELSARAVIRVAESNKIKIKGPGDRDQESGLGLDKPAYSALGKLGLATAMTRAGAGAKIKLVI